MIEVNALHRALERVCPVEAGRFVLGLGDWGGKDAPVAENDRGDLLAVLHVVIYEVDADGGRSIHSIKAQQVLMVNHQHRHRDALLEPYLEGWAQVVREAFTAEALWDNTETLALDRALPHDLVKPRVLDLVRPRTADDFARALRRKSRLGWLLA